MPEHGVPVRRLRRRDRIAAYGQTMFALRRGDIDPGTVVAALPAMAICLFGGIALDRPGAGLIAASGAFSVGFGAFQRFTSSRDAPMIFSMLGMTVAAAVGSAAGHSLPALIAVTGVFAALCGGANAAGPGAWWIALQWAIALFVAGAYPADLTGIFTRAGLILGGGLIRIAIVAAYWTLRPPPDEPASASASEETWRDLFALIAHRLVSRATILRLAVASALMSMAAVALSHLAAIPNGYWIPITALVILKPKTSITVERIAYRIIGTVAGAVAATALAALIRPGEALIAAVVVVMTGAAYSLQRSGYALFTASVTACVAFLISLNGLPEIEVVEHRVVATLIGGAFALITAGALRLLRGAPEKPPPA